MRHAGSKHVLCKEIPKQCESEALEWFAAARQIPRREKSPFIFRAYFGLFVFHFHIERENIYKGCSLVCVCVCSADGKKKGKVHLNSVYTQQLNAHIVSRTNISLPSRRRSLESRSVYILHLIWLTRMEISYGCDWKILCFCENFSMKLASFKVWRVYLSRPDRHVIDKISHNSYLSVFIVQIRKLSQLLATNFSLRKSIQKVAKPKSKTK